MMKKTRNENDMQKSFHLRSNLFFFYYFIFFFVRSQVCVYLISYSKLDFLRRFLRTTRQMALILFLFLLFFFFKDIFCLSSTHGWVEDIHDFFLLYSFTPPAKFMAKWQRIYTFFLFCKRKQKINRFIPLTGTCKKLFTKSFLPESVKNAFSMSGFVFLIFKAFCGYFF